MSDKFEKHGCEMNPELCEEEFELDGEDFGDIERDHFSYDDEGF